MVVGPAVLGCLRTIYLNGRYWMEVCGLSHCLLCLLTNRDMSVMVEEETDESKEMCLSDTDILLFFFDHFSLDVFYCLECFYSGSVFGCSSKEGELGLWGGLGLEAVG